MSCFPGRAAAHRRSVGQREANDPDQRESRRNRQSVDATTARLRLLAIRRDWPGSLPHWLSRRKRPARVRSVLPARTRWRSIRGGPSLSAVQESPSPQRALVVSIYGERPAVWASAPSLGALSELRRACLLMRTLPNKALQLTVKGRAPIGRGRVRRRTSALRSAMAAALAGS